MHRSNLYVLVTASVTMGLATAAGAQQPSAPDQYQGVSQPPPETINTTADTPPVIAKPSAGVLAGQPQPYQSGQPVQPQPGSYGPAAPSQGYQNYPPPAYAPPNGGQGYAPAADPDGDIVHPRPAAPGELTEGSTIRVRLINRISSSNSEKGEPFQGQVASDVMQDGRVLIPAGSAIEGRVSEVSAGHFGGHGSFRLHPEAVILPDGGRYQLHAYTTGTPGSKTRMGSEGTINPGSRAKKDGIEYGSVVGAGAITGAIVGGPVGALTGSLIGAGIVTTHLMVDHPQATLEPGSILLFTLTEPMNLMPLSANNQ